MTLVGTSLVLVVAVATHGTQGECVTGLGTDQVDTRAMTPSSTIGKGPRKRWSSFLEGQVVRMFRASARLCPRLGMEDRQVSRCGVDLVSLEGTRYLVTKIQMELLEICCNLVSSVRHNRFKGHFEFRIEALIGEERGNHGRGVRRVVVRKFSQREEIEPNCPAGS